VSTDFKLPSGMVWQRYEQWCNDNGFTPKSSIVFSRELRNHGVKVGKSNGKRYVYGVQLTEPPPQQWTSANDMDSAKTISSGG
jgi:phage/plasmid-associated DNA primase